MFSIVPMYADIWDLRMEIRELTQQIWSSETREIVGDGMKQTIRRKREGDRERDILQSLALK